MKKILILAYDFPPYISAGSLRPYSWYESLHEFGVYPVVITRQWDNKYGNHLDYVAHSGSAQTIIEENEQSLKKEIELLSKISGADKFLVICMGDASFKETKKTIKDNIYKIYHYANYGYDKVKERIRQDLREIIKNVR